MHNNKWDRGTRLFTSGFFHQTTPHRPSVKAFLKMKYGIVYFDHSGFNDTAVTKNNP
jgi:hypothetical protein